MTGVGAAESVRSDGAVPAPVDTSGPVRRELEPPTQPERRVVRPWGYRLVERIGQVLLVAGALLLSFLAFQLWGTALQHERAQDDLADELARDLAEHATGRTVEGVTAEVGGDNASAGGPSGREVASQPGTSRNDDGGTGLSDLVVIPNRPRPEAGAALARIEAPTIGLDKTVVQGVGRPQLRAGPGLYPISPLPGHRGNVAIAGHRTTHGSPFAELDQLQPGDPIVLETVDGLFTYRVEGQRTPEGDVSGHRIVEPDAVDVVADLGDSRLTLTSCHPRYSDRQRLIVTAVLEGPAVAFAAAEPAEPALVPDRLEQLADDRPGARGADRTSSGERPPRGAVVPSSTGLDEPLGWQFERWPEAGLWALVLLVTVVPAVLLHRRRGRFLALASLVVLSSYPLVQLFSVVDAMAPAW
jgi:sortase A